MTCCIMKKVKSELEKSGLTMKNDDQRSKRTSDKGVLETKKRRRKLAIKRTVPVLAYCLTIALVLGIGIFSESPAYPCAAKYNRRTHNRNA